MIMKLFHIASKDESLLTGLENVSVTRRIRDSQKMWVATGLDNLFSLRHLKRLELSGMWYYDEDDGDDTLALYGLDLPEGYSSGI
jgi:hypothetical protein